eukprot:scaffold1153_cov94-Isochrysis_galbana.AAC.9
MPWTGAGGIAEASWGRHTAGGEYRVVEIPAGEVTAGETYGWGNSTAREKNGWEKVTAREKNGWGKVTAEEVMAAGEVPAEGRNGEI